MKIGVIRGGFHLSPGVVPVPGSEDSVDFRLSRGVTLGNVPILTLGNVPILNKTKQGMQVMQIS